MVDQKQGQVQDNREGEDDNISKSAFTAVAEPDRGLSSGSNRHDIPDLGQYTLLTVSLSRRVIPAARFDPLDLPPTRTLSPSPPMAFILPKTQFKTLNASSLWAGHCHSGV